MFGNLAEMAGLMKKAKDIQKNMKGMKEELAQAEITGCSPCNKVKVVLSGDFIVKKLSIAPDCVSDVAALENLITAAVNNALETTKKDALEKITGLTGGINIPGLF
ncbi:MAG: YbaB/EbfC family nucleoid-associated protein [Victivallaceae bacterium]